MEPSSLEDPRSSPVLSNEAHVRPPLIVRGASTGGTDALRTVLDRMPEDAPGIAVVQHMPAGFTRAFAERLNGLVALDVREARNGEPLLAGQVRIAPGDPHLLIRRSATGCATELRDGPLVSRHRPSVDVLFRSAARTARRRVVAALLTGMGQDGARGMADLFESGAYTVAQDEASCVVYGMLGAAVSRGVVKEIVPLPRIGTRLVAIADEMAALSGSFD